jgi:hypothetical protein
MTELVRLVELPPLIVAAAVELSRSIMMLGVAGVYRHVIVCLHGQMTLVSTEKLNHPIR